LRAFRLADTLFKDNAEVTFDARPDWISTGAALPEDPVFIVINCLALFKYRGEKFASKCKLLNIFCNVTDTTNLLTVLYARH